MSYLLTGTFVIATAGAGTAINQDNYGLCAVALATVAQEPLAPT